MHGCPDDSSAALAGFYHQYNGPLMHGTIDYRLARRSVLMDLQRGLLSRADVCDAHPELMRAATNIGAELAGDCPVCDEHALREVSYVFGEALRKRSGQVVYPEGALAELEERYDEFRCYVVEVCVECGWNHLSACHLMGRRAAEERRRDTASAD